MAIMYCPECGKEMSDSLKKCPHCGFKFKKNKKKITKKQKKIISIVVVAVLLLICIATVLFKVLSLSTEEKKQIVAINNNITKISEGKIEDLSKAQLKEKIDDCNSVISTYNKSNWKIKLYVKDKSKVEKIKGDCSKQIDEVDEKAVASVEEAIDKIGTVTLDSEEKISTAKIMYNHLDEEQQKKVSKSDVLESSVKTLSELKVQKVQNLIDKIGKVKYKDSCKKKIETVRTAYDDLTGNEKDIVKNYKTLSNAESEYDKLEKKKEKEDRISEIKHSISITEFYFQMNSVGGCDIYIRGVNKSKKTIKYIEYELIALNAVNDIIKSDIGYNKYTTNLQDTGPIKPGAKFGNDTYWEAAFYNSTTKSFQLTNVVVKYTDGTETKIPSKYTKYISNW